MVDHLLGSSRNWTCRNRARLRAGFSQLATKCEPYGTTQMPAQVEWHTGIRLSASIYLSKKSFSLLFWAITHQGLCFSCPTSMSSCLHLWTQSLLGKPRLFPAQHSKPGIFPSLQRSGLARSAHGPAVPPGPRGPALTTAWLFRMSLLLGLL